MTSLLPGPVSVPRDGAEGHLRRLICLCRACGKPRVVGQLLGAEFDEMAISQITSVRPV
jgi:hypothetical protein